jgi:hypothetical protein
VKKFATDGRQAPNGDLRDPAESGAGKATSAAIYEGRPRLGLTEAGLPHLLSYQYGGDSERGLGEEGSPRNWRCMAVGILRSVELREGTWKTA